MESKDEVFPLLDLPLELVEQLLEHLPSRTFVQLSSCSHYFKELASSGHYWQKLIQKEKKKIICVSPDITEWKEIFRSATEFDKIEEAVAFEKPQNEAGTRCKMILCPGTYEIAETLRHSPNWELMGLWDTPWSQKTADLRSVIVFGSKHPMLFTVPKATEEITVLKNLTLNTRQTNATSLVFQGHKVIIENCEFNSLVLALTLNTRYTVKNCLFEMPFEGGAVFGLQARGHAHLENCVFRKCVVGVDFEQCSETFAPVVENCLFDSCEDAIASGRSKGRLTIKNCTIKNNEKSGIIVDVNCAVEVVGCTIEKNETGVMVYENSIIILQDNTIINNEDYGVRMKHNVEIQQFKGNKIQRNGTGIKMPKQDAPHLTEDALMASNEISQNRVNLALEEKKKNIKSMYKEGDSDKLISDNVKLAQSRNLCTYLATATNYVPQIWYECFTCDITVCHTCLKTCHNGHSVSFQSEFSEFYCDCGAGSGCKALDSE